MFERNGEIIYWDNDGQEYVKDENGNRRPPMQAGISNPGEFAPYDDSQGHCSFCGRLTCHGNCIQGGA